MDDFHREEQVTKKHAQLGQFFRKAPRKKSAIRRKMQEVDVVCFGVSDGNLGYWKKMYSSVLGFQHMELCLLSLISHQHVPK